MNKRKIITEIINIRRHIHKYPELSSQEYKTADYIEKKLKQFGYLTERPLKNSVIGYFNREQSCLAIRADIDALPIKEQTKKTYSSTINGVMHACGHDANTAIVLGCALLLKKFKFDNKINIKFIFQPSEETSTGAKDLISNDVLKKPKVDAIIGVHVNPMIPTGKVGIKYGEMLAAVDRFRIKIYGGGGHAAQPHLGKDTILAVAELIQSLHFVKEKIDPMEQSVISICKINGGTTFNVFPENVELEGTVRTLNNTTRDQIKKLIENIVRLTVKKHSLKYNLEYLEVGGVLINSDDIVKLCYNAIAEKFGKNNILILKKASMGGEDFSEYLKYVPGCFFYVGCGDKKIIPWHHPKFDINEEILFLGANYLLNIIKKYYKIS